MKGWKTIVFNLAMLAAATPDVLGLIPPHVALYVIPLGNLILRAITTTPIGRSEATPATESTSEKPE